MHEHDPKEPRHSDSSGQPDPGAADFLYRAVVEHLHDGVYFVDTNRVIKYWNNAAENISGYNRTEVLGKACSDALLMHVDGSGCQLCSGECPLSLAMSEGAPREVRVYLRHKQGHRIPVLVRTNPIFDAQGNTIGALEIFTDDSAQDAVQKKLEELERWAFLDFLTEVGNRRYCEVRLGQALDEYRRYGRSFGVLLIDLDYFKAINDQYGHSFGDTVLRQTAKTLAGSLRSSDVLGRWGGEEFLAILPQISREHLQELGERCRALVQESALPTDAGRISITVSIGAALVEPSDSVESLLKRADELLYRSKNSGRNRMTAA